MNYPWTNGTDLLTSRKLGRHFGVEGRGFQQRRRQDVADAGYRDVLVPVLETSALGRHHRVALESDLCVKPQRTETATPGTMKNKIASTLNFIPLDHSEKVRIVPLFVVSNTGASLPSTTRSWICPGPIGPGLFFARSGPPRPCRGPQSNNLSTREKSLLPSSRSRRLAMAMAMAYRPWGGEENGSRRQKGAH